MKGKSKEEKDVNLTASLFSNRPEALSKAAMKTFIDNDNALKAGLSEIRAQYKVPEVFPAEVLKAAEEAAAREPSEHADRTDLPFVTLDPESSTDLDQAFHIESDGKDVLLHYAIADVGFFVDHGGALDKEAWARGTTFYLPDGKAPLYPPVLSQGAASLLPDGNRPAVIFTVRVDGEGNVKLDGAERAVIRSHAKLAYSKVKPSDLPKDFEELSRRIAAAEDRRGASRVDPPEQEVMKTPKGCYRLTFRPRLQSEADNAALSLATNLAIADALQAHHTGLFRVMAEPDERAVKRLRFTASAFGLEWPKDVSLEEYERTLSADNFKQAAFMLAIRRAGRGASYVPYKVGETPWHSAMAATYAHATAPLRRLADRYVVEATLAIANGKDVPAVVEEAFKALPDVMASADSKGSQIERAVIDLAEAVMLQDRVGQQFDAIVTDLDDRGARIQLEDDPVVARVDANRVDPGDTVRVVLEEANVERRLVRFRRIG